MNAIKTHKDLVVWRKSIALASAIHKATKSVPADERFELNQRLRGAAVSIASTIAEGHARRTSAEVLQSLHKARSSLMDLETQAIIAIEHGDLIDAARLLPQIAEIDRLLNELIRNRASAQQRAHARACRPLIPSI